jgi:hypothetical protein
MPCQLGERERGEKKRERVGMNISHAASAAKTPASILDQCGIRSQKILHF